MAEWKQRFPASEAVNINVYLSIQEITNPEFLGELDRIVTESAVEPAAVGLEITEDLMAEAAAEAQDLLWQIDKRGFRLLIDDFGTGRSSIAALHRFQIDKLKIDRSFIEAIESEGAAIEVVRGATTLGQSLGIEVMAEGVESVEQLAQLRQLGIGFAQG